MYNSMYFPKQSMSRMTSSDVFEERAGDGITPMQKELIRTKCDHFHSRPPGDKCVYNANEPVSIQDPVNTLLFSSEFESGNLAKAFQVTEFEYDLELTSDANARGSTQWFNFSVTNGSPSTYTFNLVNFVKSSSLYNKGLRPCFYSRKMKKWTAVGNNICYFKNRLGKPSSNSTARELYAMSFEIDLLDNNDIYYFAYCYPFTYTDLQIYLRSLDEASKRQHFYKFKREVLCTTVQGRRCDIIKISKRNKRNKNSEKTKKYLVISGRVHPGEANASWVVKGILDFLTSNKAWSIDILEHYRVILIPMLNPDGVAIGSYRCDNNGYDLNRCWKQPNEALHPTIYHTKNYIRKLIAKGEVSLFFDIHGHSRKQNVFMYGNSNARRYRLKASPKYPYCEKILPLIMSKLSSEFSFEECTFHITKKKEGTARVVNWSELGVALSYTIEASFLGASPLGDGNYTINQYQELGLMLLRAVHEYINPNQAFVQSMVSELTAMHTGRETGEMPRTIDQYGISLHRTSLISGNVLNHSTHSHLQRTSKRFLQKEDSSESDSALNTFTEWDILKQKQITRDVGDDRRKSATPQPIAPPESSPVSGISDRLGPSQSARPASASVSSQNNKERELDMESSCEKQPKLEAKLIIVNNKEVIQYVEKTDEKDTNHSESVDNDQNSMQDLGEDELADEEFEESAEDEDEDETDAATLLKHGDYNVDINIDEAQDEDDLYEEDLDEEESCSDNECEDDIETDGGNVFKVLQTSTPPLPPPPPMEQSVQSSSLNENTKKSTSSIDPTMFPDTAVESRDFLGERAHHTAGAELDPNESTDSDSSSVVNTKPNERNTTDSTTDLDLVDESLAPVQTDQESDNCKVASCSSDTVDMKSQNLKQQTIAFEEQQPLQSGSTSERTVDNKLQITESNESSNQQHDSQEHKEDEQEAADFNYESDAEDDDPIEENEELELLAAQSKSLNVDMHDWDKKQPADESLPWYDKPTDGSEVAKVENAATPINPTKHKKKSRKRRKRVASQPSTTRRSLVTALHQRVSSERLVERRQQAAALESDNFRRSFSHRQSNRVCLDNEFFTK